MTKELAIVTDFKKLVCDIAKGTMHASEPTLKTYFKQPEKAALLRKALPAEALDSFDDLGRAFEAIHSVVEWQLANGPSVSDPAITTKVRELTGQEGIDGQALYAHLKTTAKSLKKAMKLSAT